MIREEAIEYLKRADVTIGQKVKTKMAEALDMAIKALEQEQKTGHWIDKSKQSGCGVNFIHIECSECGELSGLNNTYARYCPWCGVKMIEQHESEE